jgi:hypothetical protein
MASKALKYARAPVQLAAACQRAAGNALAMAGSTSWVTFLPSFHGFCHIQVVFHRGLKASIVFDGPTGYTIS